MTDIKRTLWGVGTPRTLRPLWALIELGLAFEHRKVVPRTLEMDNPELLALTKRQKVPFYTEDRVQIGESAAIVDYLADHAESRNTGASSPNGSYDVSHD